MTSTILSTLVGADSSQSLILDLHLYLQHYYLSRSQRLEIREQIRSELSDWYSSFSPDFSSISEHSRS